MIALRKYIGTAIRIYVYVRSYIALYDYCSRVLCFIYIGLYMELEQEKYM